jgi:hypothetical protein
VNRGSIEHSNLSEIERLNQRGGRTLSFVDLIEAGTVSAEMAGELAALVESGASILTAAKKGGVGKSTVLADLLACLPPGERIVATPDLAAVEAARAAETDEPVCFLAHEIGAGPWHAYLWGEAAARFFDLAGGGRRVASCLHADDIDELSAVLGSQGVSPDAVNRIGLVLFMRRGAQGRRVESVYVPGPEAHRLRWLRDEAEDELVPKGPPAAPTERSEIYAGLFEELVENGVHDFAEVRRALVRLQGA